MLRDVVGAAGCPRLVVVDYITSSGAALFEAVRQIGAEGIWHLVAAAGGGSVVSAFRRSGLTWFSPDSCRSV